VPRVRAEPRRRDPRRPDRILEAAAQLVSRHGYHDVSMADIGAAAGVTGSAIYRHFEGKSAVLVALLDRILDDLAEQTAAVLARPADPRAVLGDLVAGQVRFVLEQRSLAVVFYQESTYLPEVDRTRLRRKQRLYIEEWVTVLGQIRTDVPIEERRTLVHAAIGSLQSLLFFTSEVPAERLTVLMTEVAERTLLT
jgi:AcrR family transcriptional regulator